MNIPDAVLKAQAKASDPAASVFVAANAGSGKTHVLTQRVVRLLLSGAAPSRILCLTYTKAAAAEMQGRVFGNLSRWTTLADEALAAELATLGRPRADAEELAAARRLFAEALETPGGLKIQTIHAFCEAILHQFPLEAGVPGHFEVLDDPQSAILVAEARRMLLRRARDPVPGEETRLAEAFAEALSLGGENGLKDLIGEVLSKRDRLSAHLEEAGGLEGALARLAAALRLDPEDDEDSVLAGLWPCPHFSPADVSALIAAGSVSGSVGDVKTAERLRHFADEALPLQERFAGYCAAVLDSKGVPRASLRGFITKAVAQAIVDCEEKLAGAGTRALELRDRLASVRLFRASGAALTIAERLQADYSILKRRRGRLDFEDLVVRTADLLTRREAAAWVHYKLDRGIDHVLVDEAQDTSPRQWQVVRALIEEFFAGEGARQAPRNQPRTIFAVGDEKQSIYSFQGASPAMFAHQRGEVDASAKGAGANFEPVKLELSFRSAPEILQAVDGVFKDEDNRRGLTAENLPPVHESARRNARGLVEIWPTLRPEERVENESWLEPLDHEPEASPANRLARRIAARIEDWIGAPVRAKKGVRALGSGDFVILVRKRTGFVQAMGNALKERGIAVAGADRIVITEHLAVQDLMTLGRVVANTEDELSLAAVLKSPLFGFSDDDLMHLALSRRGEEPGPLYLALRLAAGEGGAERFSAVPDVPERQRLASLSAAAFARLEALRERAGFSGVFSFYARIVGPEGGRAALAARLGPDVGEVLDAFLDLALAHEAQGTAGLDAFLADLAANPPTVKREMGEAHGQVRIMTTHAAKGLEAPVVFLVDPGSAPFVHAHGAKLIEWEGMPGLAPNARPGWLWCPEKSLANGVIETLRNAEQEKAEEEYRRLLYVGMTRAADRLVICGYCGPKGPNAASWLERVTLALASDRNKLTDAAGETIGWRLGGVETDLRVAVAVDAGAGMPAPEAPPLDLSPLPPETLPPRPLSPSAAGVQALGGETQEGGDPAPPASAASSRAMRRGTLLHRLLQALPELPETDRERAAEAFLAGAAPEFDESERRAMVVGVGAVLSDPAFAAIFSPGSRAEVALSGTIRLSGRDWRVNGTVDRLAVGGESVLIVDYKTSRAVPADASGVPAGQILQLALYRRLLQPLYPDRAVRAALLFTEGPRLVALDEAALEGAIEAVGRAPA